MQAREQVEEGAVRILHQISALFEQIPPGNQLRRQEGEAQGGRRQQQPVRRSPQSPPKHPPRGFKRHAAHQNQRRAQPQNARQTERLPVGRHAGPPNIRDHQRRKKRGDGRARRPNENPVRPRRRLGGVLQRRRQHHHLVGLRRPVADNARHINSSLLPYFTPPHPGRASLSAPNFSTGVCGDVPCHAAKVHTSKKITTEIPSTSAIIGAPPRSNYAP